MSDVDLDTRKKIRRSALVFGGIAIAFYVGFILVGVLRA